jgi:hypothetical protein
LKAVASIIALLKKSASVPSFTANTHRFAQHIYTVLEMVATLPFKKIDMMFTTLLCFRDTNVNRCLFLPL